MGTVNLVLSSEKFNYLTVKQTIAAAKLGRSELLVTACGIFISAAVGCVGLLFSAA
jgi:hypothetical protein